MEAGRKQACLTSVFRKDRRSIPGRLGERICGCPKERPSRNPSKEFGLGDLPDCREDWDENEVAKYWCQTVPCLDDRTGVSFAARCCNLRSGTRKRGTAAAVHATDDGAFEPRRYEIPGIPQAGLATGAQRARQSRAIGKGEVRSEERRVG